MMKTRILRISKRTLSMILALLMMFSILMVGTVTTVAGYSSLASKTIYFDNTNTNYSTVYIYIGHGSYAKSYKMTNTGAHNIWKFTFNSSDAWNDRTKLYFCSRNDSPDGQDYGIDTQHNWPSNNQKTNLISANNADGGSCFFPAGNSNSNLTRHVIRVVAGESPFTSSAWSNTADLMTYSSSQHTYTYSNVAKGSYVFAVVGFDDWGTSYRWSVKGTATNCTIEDAGDNDHNIKVTLPVKSNLTITLTSSNKVNVSATPTDYSGLSASAKYSTNGSSFSSNLAAGVTIDKTTVAKGSSVNVTAPSTVTGGYTFYQWYSSNGSFGDSSSTSTTFTPNAQNAVAIARYKKQYTFSGSKAGAGGGTLTVPTGTILAGDRITITAEPNSYSELTSLKVNNSTVTTTNNSYTANASFSTTTSIPVVATFSLKNLPITYDTAASHFTYGSSNATSAKYGDRVTITVTPATDYAVTVKVNNGDVAVTNNGNNTYTFTMPPKEATVSVTAKSTLTYGTIHYGVHSSGHGSIRAAYTSDGSNVANGTANIRTGTGITFTATPNAGYTVEGWYSDSSCTTRLSGSSSTYDYTMDEGGNYVYVKYVPVTPVFTVSGGTLSGGSYYFDSTKNVTGTISNYSSYPSGTTFKLNGTTVTPNASGVFTYAASNLTTSAKNYTLTATINGTESTASSAVSMLKVNMVNLKLAPFSHGDVTVTYKNVAGVDTNLTSASTVRAKSGTNVKITASNFATDYEFKKVTDGTTVKTTNPATYTISADTTYTVTIGEIDYIYFYAALQKKWNSNPIVTVDGEEVTAVQVLYGEGKEVTLYNGRNSQTKILDNDFTFRVSLFKVNANKAGSTVTVGNSASGGGCITADTNYDYKLPATSGYLYYTHSTPTNYCGRIDPQLVAISGISAEKVGEYNSKDIYDATGSLSVKVDSTQFYYTGGNSRKYTAGGDSVKLTYEVYRDNGASEDTLVYSLKDREFAESTSISLANVKNSTGFVNGGEYYVKVTSADSASGKIKQVSNESTHFYIEGQYNVTVSGAKTDGTALMKATPTFTVAGTIRNNNYTFSAGTCNTVTVTAADLTTSGYKFERWETSDGVTVSSTSSITTTVTATKAGTLKAVYSLIKYNAGVGSNASVINSGDKSNKVYVNENGTVSVQLTVEDTLTAIAKAYAADGYALDHIELRNATGTILNGNYSFGPMPAQAVKVYAVFKAMTPTITASDITVYAGQPITTRATTNRWSGTSITGYAMSAGTPSSSTTDGTITAPTTGIDINNGTNFTMTITAVNNKSGDLSGGSNIATATKNITVHVEYTDLQKAYLKLEELHKKYDAYGITQDDLTNSIDSFIDSLTVAGNALTGLPAWDSTDPVSTYTDLYNNLNAEYDKLIFKTNTIYALVRSSYSSNVKVHVKPNEGKTVHVDGWFVDRNSTNRTGDAQEGIDNSVNMVNGSELDYFMTKEGETTNGKILYSFKYIGKADFIIYHTNTANSTVYSGRQLTGDVNLKTATSSNVAYSSTTNKNIYGEYYIDLKNISVNSTSTTVSSVTAFADFAMTDYTANSQTLENDLLEKSKSYSLNDIIGSDRLNINFTGSLKASGQKVNTKVTITGPDNKEFILTSSSEWTPQKSGKYTLTLKAIIGKDERPGEGTPTFELTEKEYTLYVAYDEITVYADMNGNVGTPILSFNYSYYDEKGQQVTGTLPYEFDLETGSESVYSVVLSLPVLRNYGYTDITTTGIVVDTLYIDTDEYSGFTIEKQALRTGTVWLKANSTHMTGFNQIAYGSANRSFKAVFRDGSNDIPVTNPFAVASGSGVITDELLNNGTDDYYNYNVFYAANDGVSNFSYNVKVEAENDLTRTVGNTPTHYYFDHWEDINGETETIQNIVSGTDININLMPEYEDVTYVAVYKPVSTSKRVEITYKFEDYDTDDGNYVYDPQKTTKAEEYVKTFKVDGAVSASNASDIASANAPIIKSNYYDYTFNSATYKTYDSATNKYKVEAKFDKTPHKYKIVVKKPDNTVEVKTGNYQQPLELKAGDFGVSGNYHWSIYEGSTERVLATDKPYTARFVNSNDLNNNGVLTIHLKAGTATVATGVNSAITYSYTGTYYSGSTQRARHNFYIIDTTAKGKLIGGGVLYATAENGEYRQPTAGNTLDTPEHMTTYINNILNGTYDKEYKPQTINNVGFRYLPYEKGKDVFRYSDAMGAYIYTFAGDNNNNISLQGQTLRVFSYFIYDNGGTKSVVVSNMYAECSRYVDNNPSGGSV